MALKTEEKPEKQHPHREKELARRAAFKDVKSVTTQGKIEKGSVTSSHGHIG